MTDAEIIKVFRRNFVRFADMMPRDWRAEAAHIQGKRVELALWLNRSSLLPPLLPTSGKSFQGTITDAAAVKRIEELCDREEVRRDYHNWFSDTPVDAENASFVVRLGFDRRAAIVSFEIALRSPSGKFARLKENALAQLFVLFRGSDYGKALADLIQEYEIDADPFASVGIGGEWQVRPIPRIASVRVAEEYPFFDEKDFIVSMIDGRTEDGKRSLLPRTRFSIAGQEYWLPMLPEPCPLYRPLPFCDKPRQELTKDVVLTDSLECAFENHRRWEWNGCQDLEWRAWYGGLRGITATDWRSLEGRTVYYLLMEHSGYGTSLVHMRASAARDALKKVGVGEVKFVSYLHSGFPAERQSGLIASTPEILNEEQFDRFFAGRPPWRLEASATYLPRVAAQRFLFGPIIRSRSITLLVGERGSGKTWAALSAAYAVSQGTGLPINWRRTEPCSVLYLHERRGSASGFGERLSAMLRMQIGEFPLLVDCHELAPDAPPLPEVSVPGISPCATIRPFPQRRETEQHRLETLSEEENGALTRVKYKCFYWSEIPPRSMDVTNHGTQCQILEMVQAATGVTGQQGWLSPQHSRLLVLDGLMGLEKLISGDGGTMSAMNCFFDELRLRDIAVILVPSLPSVHLSTIERANRLPIDNLIELSREIAPVVNDVGMLALIHKTTSKCLPEGFPTVLALEFSADAAIPVWSALQKPISRTRRMWFIKSLSKAGFNSKQIARFLVHLAPDGVDVGVKEEVDKTVDRMHSTVRKAKRDLGLSKPRGRLSPLGHLHSSIRSLGLATKRGDRRPSPQA